MKKYKAIIFDLDGVLIDSKQNMSLAWSQVKKKTGIKKSFKEYFKYIGLPFTQILFKLKINNNHRKIQNIYSSSSIKNLKKIALYKNVLKTLNILKNKKIKICVVTSKDKSRTKKIIRSFKLPIKHSFSPSSSYRGKPHPELINRALKKLSLTNKETCYVGDMLVDQRTAVNAKMDFIYTSYGYGNYKKKFKNSIKNLEEILKLIK